MSDSHPNPVANALRKAGYVPLPRLWVKKEDMPAIHNITSKHRTAVNSIRGAINKDQSEYEDQPLANPVLDKDAAWAAYEKMRGG